MENTTLFDKNEHRNSSFRRMFSKYNSFGKIMGFHRVFQKIRSLYFATDSSWVFLKPLEYNLANMYMKTDSITVIVLFLVIIGISIWFSSTPSYVPYSSTVFSQQAKFEAFSTRKGTEYSTVGDNAAVDGPVSGYLIHPISSGPKAVAGFEGVGVFNTPEVATKEKLDIYSQASGSLTSEGYGYYNSRGSLVLDENMKKMLQTRGGNISGASSVVGGSPA